MKKKIWLRPYYPRTFEKEAAEVLVRQLETSAEPARNMIHGAKAKPRRGKPDAYDVLILTDAANPFARFVAGPGR